jgi:hypothetical protein
MRSLVLLLSTAGFLVCLLAGTNARAESTKGKAVASKPSPQPAVATDVRATVRFAGSRTADLFTLEISESLQGLIERNARPLSDPELAGFVSASIDGRPWTDTMWTRDSGVFLRELVHWGYLGHAAATARYLMEHVKKSDAGFFTFPQHLDPRAVATGSEIDGTSAIVIGMVLLWERMPASDPARAHLYEFLHQPASPLRYMTAILSHQPLVSGSGEFGGGMGIGGDFLNVVQNGLVRLALAAGARMEQAAGDRTAAAEYRAKADALGRSMVELLRGPDGAWIWALRAADRKPDPAILASVLNRGFGGINGVLAMYADVYGLDPGHSNWGGIPISTKTLDKVGDFPMRRAQFEKHGIWTQFDVLAGGYLTSPSYGQGYALQSLLLLDRLEAADRALRYLAQATFAPPKEYVLHRDSPYWFYERLYSPDAVGRVTLEEGCGALNLVNVAEPLKVARLMVGVDDSDAAELKVLPRLPPSISSYEVTALPVRTSRGTSRINLKFEREPAGGGKPHIELHVTAGPPLPKLAVRLQGPKGPWQRLRDVSKANLSAR